jgi:hypothetical protein
MQKPLQNATVNKNLAPGGNTFVIYGTAAQLPG